jgi:hypothetical protein
MAVSLEYPVCFVTQHTADPVHTYGTPIIVKPLPTGTLTNILVRVRVLAIIIYNDVRFLQEKEKKSLIWPWLYIAA